MGIFSLKILYDCHHYLIIKNNIEPHVSICLAQAHLWFLLSSALCRELSACANNSKVRMHRMMFCFCCAPNDSRSKPPNTYEIKKITTVSCSLMSGSVSVLRDIQILSVGRGTAQYGYISWARVLWAIYIKKCVINWVFSI